MFLFYNDRLEPLYRIDTLANVYMFPLSFNDHLYKLDADSGTAWISWTNVAGYNYYGWVQAIEQGIVFGRLTTIKVVHFGLLHPDSGGNTWFYRKHYLASGFGLIYEWNEPFYVSWLRGCVIAGDTFGTLVSVPIEKPSLPQELHLQQNYPNPFNPTTVISYQLPAVRHVKLSVYDVLGREVATLVDGMKEAGFYTANFDGSKLSSGVYYYRLTASNPHSGKPFTDVKKLVLIK